VTIKCLRRSGSVPLARESRPPTPITSYPNAIKLGRRQPMDSTR